MALTLHVPSLRLSGIHRGIVDLADLDNRDKDDWLGGTGRKRVLLDRTEYHISSAVEHYCKFAVKVQVDCTSRRGTGRPLNAF